MIVLVASLFVLSQCQSIEINDQWNPTISTVDLSLVTTKYDDHVATSDENRTNSQELTAENGTEKQTDILLRSSYSTDLIDPTHESSTSMQSTVFVVDSSTNQDVWLNSNQKNLFDSLNYSISWRKMNVGSSRSPMYVITSERQCLDRMCSARLFYGGTLLNDVGGCLSFILSMRGQPVGQLWIEEDEAKDNLSQKIQLTNSSLRVEHSLKPNIKTLSIDARILFSNVNLDSIELSNLTVSLNGPCRQLPSDRQNRIVLNDVSTLKFEKDIVTATTDAESILQTDFFGTSDHLNFSDEHVLVQSSTKPDRSSLVDRRSFSLVNQTNVTCLLFWVVLFCLIVILFSFLYGLWSINERHRFVWHVHLNKSIQFIRRISIRSSSRSITRIGTLAQLSNEHRQENLQHNDVDDSVQSSFRSGHSSFYASF